MLVLRGPFFQGRQLLQLGLEVQVGDLVEVQVGVELQLGVHPNLQRGYLPVRPGRRSACAARDKS